MVEFADHEWRLIWAARYVGNQTQVKDRCLICLQHRHRVLPEGSREVPMPIAVALMTWPDLNEHDIERFMTRRNPTVGEVRSPPVPLAHAFAPTEQLPPIMGDLDVNRALDVVKEYVDGLEPEEYVDTIREIMHPALTARVYVTLRDGILDSQGQAVARALGNLGFEGVNDVRVGKLFEIDLSPDTDPFEAQRLAAEMAQQVLANTVMEKYQVVIQGLSEPVRAEPAREADHITEKDLLKVCRLARITPPPKGSQRDKMIRDLDATLGYIQQLKEVDTDGVEPMTSAELMDLPMRDDVVTDGDRKVDIMANAPDPERGFFTVPKVVE